MGQAVCGKSLLLVLELALFSRMTMPPGLFLSQILIIFAEYNAPVRWPIAAQHLRQSSAAR